MNRRTLWTVGVIAVIVILPAAWYLGSPLFINNRVDEAFPAAANAGSTGSDATADHASGGGEAAQNSEAGTTSEDGAVLEGGEEASTAPETEAKLEDVVMDEPMPAEPSAVGQGSFIGADNFHQGEGSVTIYVLQDGQRVLRFEDFEVTNGPDLHVLLAEGANPTSREDLGDYVDLGMLKGNIGDQNYDLPADVEPDAYQSVVIYCMPFHVVFAAATLLFE